MIEEMFGGQHRSDEVKRGQRVGCTDQPTTEND